jgi:hypothetical protein
MNNDINISQSWDAREEVELTRKILRLEKTVATIEADGLDAVAVTWEKHFDWRQPKSGYVRAILARTPFEDRRKLDHLLEIEDVIFRQAQPTSGFAHSMAKKYSRTTFDDFRQRYGVVFEEICDELFPDFRRIEAGERAERERRERLQTARARLDRLEQRYRELLEPYMDEKSRSAWKELGTAT